MRNSITKILMSMFVCAMIIVSLFNLRINNVEISGNTKLDDMEVLSYIFENDYEKNPIYFYIRNKFFGNKNINYVSSYDIEWKTPFSIEININEKPSIAFFKRELQNICFDRDGTINDVTADRKENLIEVSGVEFTTFEMGEKIDIRDKKLQNAILNISTSLNSYGLPVKYLEVKNGEITAFVGNIIVALGDTENMEIKIQRLNDIYKEIESLSGTLYLSNARENMLDEHYIFKKN